MQSYTVALYQYLLHSENLMQNFFHQVSAFFEH